MVRFKEASSAGRNRGRFILELRGISSRIADDTFVMEIYKAEKDLI